MIMEIYDKDRNKIHSDSHYHFIPKSVESKNRGPEFFGANLVEYCGAEVRAQSLLRSACDGAIERVR